MIHNAINRKGINTIWYIMEIWILLNTIMEIQEQIKDLLFIYF